MPNGQKEYDVYILIRHDSVWRWIFWWLRPTYEVVLGTAADTAENAAKSAQIKANAAGDKAIGIAADALICCEQPVNAGGGNTVGSNLAR